MLAWHRRALNDGVGSVRASGLMISGAELNATAGRNDWRPAGKRRGISANRQVETPQYNFFEIGVRGAHVPKLL
jgi:hypothetical protein